jgi:hypothetical protein
MYRGFNLVLPESIADEIYLSKGKELKEKTFNHFKNRLIDFIAFEGVIDGNKVIEKWFPLIDCDIFLSHSHKDEAKAITLAGLLYENFGLKTFIDSTVWEYSDILLRVLDEKYCKNENGETFSYEKRNFSTAHVHLMLNSALNKMIDNCEAVFFLNTPNSISASNTISESTRSPWIFSEIATTQIIRKKTPERLKQYTRTYSSKVTLSESARSQLNIEYQLELSHLTKLDLRDIKYWINSYKYTNQNPLDLLYSFNKINNKFFI